MPKLKHTTVRVRHDATQPDAETYIVDAIISFLNDPPDTMFQRGYEAAFRAIYLDLWGTAEMRGLNIQKKLDWNELMRAMS